MKRNLLNFPLLMSLWTVIATACDQSLEREDPRDVFNREYRIAPNGPNESGEKQNLMYWYFDKGGPDDTGDLLRNIHASNQQVAKDLDFQLPFFGSRFNSMQVSVNGYVGFSDPPEDYTYPLVFPIRDWPRRKDPSFIGIFFSRCRIGRIHQSDWDQRRPGVYFRQERDLMTRTDRFGVEVRERVMWDIREGVVGSDTFIPKHVVIVTWKNISFAGGVDNSLFKTNTFQIVLATDDVNSYAIFNYEAINWSSHTEAGGDTSSGEGGVPAFVGFNAGNGTGSYEYLPYSQSNQIKKLTEQGWGNDVPGRHIFKIDEKVTPGSCMRDIDAVHLPLVFAPNSGNMLGGTIVNITGPCFLPYDKIECIFGNNSPVAGEYIDSSRAKCLQPLLNGRGYITLAIRLNDGPVVWKGWYFVEAPHISPNLIAFEDSSVYDRKSSKIEISWDKFNLTWDLEVPVTISLFGYWESDNTGPKLEYIGSIEEGWVNNGTYTIYPSKYESRTNNQSRDIEFGFLQIQLSDRDEYGVTMSPKLWSKPIPLAWYFNAQWSRLHGPEWPQKLCNNWINRDRYSISFHKEPIGCPQSLNEALNDKGKFMNDSTQIEPQDNELTVLTSAVLEHSFKQKQCYYNKKGSFVKSVPRKSYIMGLPPAHKKYVDAPTLSQWFNDIRPYYTCCQWQQQDSEGCKILNSERRPSADRQYESPVVVETDGQRFVSFDGTEFKFNRTGVFILLEAYPKEIITNKMESHQMSASEQSMITVQACFQKSLQNKSTQLTSIAVRGTDSTLIEVRLRQEKAQWRYRMDVLANGRRIYFDRDTLKLQVFDLTTVYSPSNVYNHSEIVIMLPSNVGIEVTENKGYMNARMFVPKAFMKKTDGLLGNFVSKGLEDFEAFATKWKLDDKLNKSIHWKGRTVETNSQIFTFSSGSSTAENLSNHCETLKAPKFGSKSVEELTLGTVVSFECNEGYFLEGDSVRECNQNGEWIKAEYGYTRCSSSSSNQLNTACLKFFLVLLTVTVMCIIGFILFRSRQKKNYYYGSLNTTEKEKGLNI